MKRFNDVTLLVLVVAFLATPAMASAPSPTNSPERGHCVATVTDQRSDGELVLADPVCFSTFDEAMRFAGANSTQTITPANLNGGAVAAGSYILAVHYDQTSYNGLSLTVTAQSPQCTGGYINFRTAYTFWNNRFESILYSCDGGPIKHWDIAPASGGSCSGSQFNATKNEPTLGAMNNKTSCVVYGP